MSSCGTRPNRPSAGTTPAVCSTTPCPAGGSAPGSPPSDPEDEALIRCILQLCRTDRDIVRRASRDLTLYSRRPKRIELQRYEGGRWVTRRTVISGGTTRGTEVWINRGEDCAETQETVYHEVMHTMPRQQSMNSRDREIDAYTRTAQWQIDRGVSGRFQTTNPDGTRSVDRAAIIRHVDGAYGYSSGELRIVGRENGGRTVVLEDGTRRPAREGDQFQYRPPQDLQERRIPSDRLRCP